MNKKSFQKSCWLCKIILHSVFFSVAFASASDAGSATVTISDVSFVRPDASGMTISPITGYNWRKSRVEDWSKNNSHWDWPMINKNIVDRDTNEYWDNLVEELLFSRVDVISLHGRGAWYPNDPNKIGKSSGDMDPRLLKRFVEAVDRVGDGARASLKVAMWDDTAMYSDSYRYQNGGDRGTNNFDMSKQANWDFMFDSNVKLWFDTLPRDMWYKIESRPVISAWKFQSEFKNTGKGNLKKLMNHICRRFSDRYGVAPFYILQDSWFDEDPSLKDVECVKGKHNWFSHDNKESEQYMKYKNIKTGVLVPGFQSPVGHENFRFDDRENGNLLISGFNQGVNNGADFVLLEGWTNLIEGAGFYRSLSKKWLYPNQYINIVRKYADPNPASLRFQAEAADTFSDTTSNNTLGDYSSRGIDVKRMTGGWYVGDTKAGEWLEFKDITLGGGTYRFTIRAATNAAGKKVKLNLPGMSTVTLPNTGGAFRLFHLGEVGLSKAAHKVRLEIQSDGINIDWFHMKKK